MAGGTKPAAARKRAARLTPTIALLVSEMRDRRGARLHWWKGIGRGDRNDHTFVSGLEEKPRRINPRTAEAMKKHGLLVEVDKDWRRTIFKLAPARRGSKRHE